MLTVHKNTKNQRESKQVRQSLKEDAKEAATLQDIKAYVVIAWDDEGSFKCLFDNRTKIPSSLIGELAKRALERITGIRDTNDIIDERFY